MAWPARAPASCSPPVSQGDVPGIPGVGGAIYNNLVEGNFIVGNGLGGVTLHSLVRPARTSTATGSPTPNVIGRNNLAPDLDFGPQFVDSQTTGVIVVAASNVTITIARNLIFNNVNGIFLGQVSGATITVTGVGTNRFIRVAHDVVTVS